MKYSEIKSIIKDFEQSTLTVLELEAENVKLRLSKNKDQGFKQDVNQIKNENTTENLVNTNDNNQPTQPQNLTPTMQIKSPLVGTFYESSNPKGKAFVNVGDEVKKGQVVCIVEAMKIMNQITSEFDGTIEKVLFNNGDVVGFDDTLFVLV